MHMSTRDLFYFADHCSLKAAASELAAEVCHHRDDLQQIDERLLEIEQRSKLSKDSQLPLKEDTTSIMNKLTELSEQVQQLSQEKDNTKTKLQLSERDCILLYEMQKVHDEEKCKLLQKMIDDKEREIKQLQEELKQKEYKLECAQQEAKALREKLSKVQEELEARHEVMLKLQKEKEELIKSYNSEREIVSNLAQSTLALTSDRDEMKVHTFSFTELYTITRPVIYLSLLLLSCSPIATTDLNGR